MGDEKKFNKYKRYGGYHWKWYDRKPEYTRHVDFLKEWVTEKNTIDIGAGDGCITHHLGIRGIDNDPYGIAAASRRNMVIEFGDAYDLPYADEEFDSALMSETIEHFSDINRPLSEARRVIKQYLYVNIPKAERFTEPDHYHAWTPQEFIRDVERNGFELVEGPISGKRTFYFKFKKV